MWCKEAILEEQRVSHVMSCFAGSVTLLHCPTQALFPCVGGSALAVSDKRLSCSSVPVEGGSIP